MKDIDGKKIIPFSIIQIKASINIQTSIRIEYPFKDLPLIKFPGNKFFGGTDHVYSKWVFLGTRMIKSNLSGKFMSHLA